jgi:hypothetical protein
MSKITIIIDRPAQKGNRRRRGPLNVPRQTDYLKRRNNFRPVNFYDLGQYLDGSVWKDVPYGDNVGHVVSVTDSGGTYDFWEVDDFTLSKWSDLYTSLLGIAPIANWKSKFRKIAYADGPKYGLSVYQGRGAILTSSTVPNPANQLRPGTNPEWKPVGLKPLASWMKLEALGGLTLGFDTNDGVNYKITDTYDYSAPDAGLSFEDGADVFLIPQIFYGFAQQTGLAAVPTLTEADLFGGWTIKSRDLWLEKTLRKSGVEYPVFEGWNTAIPTYDSAGAWMNSAVSGAIGDAFATQIIDRLKAIPGARLWAMHGLVADNLRGFESLSNFPYGPSSNPNTTIYRLFNSEGGYAEWLGAVTASRYDGAGLLCAVVVNSFGTRYIWRKATTDNFVDWTRLRVITPQAP